MNSYNIARASYLRELIDLDPLILYQEIIDSSRNWTYYYSSQRAGSSNESGTTSTQQVGIDVDSICWEWSLYKLCPRTSADGSRLVTLLDLDFTIEVSTPNDSEDQVYAQLLALCDLPDNKDRLINLGVWVTSGNDFDGTLLDTPAPFPDLKRVHCIDLRSFLKISGACLAILKSTCERSHPRSGFTTEVT